MLVILYLVVAYFIGQNFRHNFNLVRLYKVLLITSGSSDERIDLTTDTDMQFEHAKLSSYLLKFLIYWPIDLIIGLYLSSTFNYFIHLFIVKISNTVPNVPSLIIINSLFLLLLTSLRRYFKNVKRTAAEKIEQPLSKDSPSSFSRNPKFIAILCLQVISIFWGIFLTQRSFQLNGSTLAAGATVFSDLAPHTANVRNFAFGNIPSSYPHFAGAGMNYHFFFYYLCGLLNALGLRLDWAINLPSILGILAFMQSLFYISILLTRKLSAGFLSLIFFCFRSSFSGFSVFFAELRESNNLWLSFKNLWSSSSYSGPLQHDDWGLYNLNVYANQRHLLFVLSIAVWVLISFYPSLKNKSKVTWQEIIGLSFLGLPMAYWHGSVLISLNLILIVWALFSKSKAQYLTFGITNVLGALVMLKIFTKPGNSGSMFKNIFHFGYILDNPNIISITQFLLILYGISLFIIVLTPFLLKEKSLKIVSASLLLPVIFAFTISLTPDTTVNHKFFIFTQILFIPFISHFMVNLWTYARSKTAENQGKIYKKASTKSARTTKLINYLCKTACIVGIFIMTFSGIIDFSVYKNASLNRVEIQTADNFSQWMYQHTEPNSINLTPPWHYHSYFATGRMSYFGWPYYAQSAGYDIETREQEIRRILLAELNDYRRTKDYLQKNNINYLMIDDFWRNYEDVFINEDQLAQWFPEAAYFPEQNNLRIYKIS